MWSWHTNLRLWDPKLHTPSIPHALSVSVDHRITPGDHKRTSVLNDLYNYFKLYNIHTQPVTYVGKYTRREGLLFAYVAKIVIL